MPRTTFAFASTAEKASVQEKEELNDVDRGLCFSSFIGEKCLGPLVSTPLPFWQAIDDNKSFPLLGVFDFRLVWVYLSKTSKILRAAFPCWRVAGDQRGQDGRT
jgi:hypothetical protein